MYVGAKGGGARAAGEKCCLALTLLPPGLRLECEGEKSSLLGIDMSLQCTHITGLPRQVTR